MRRGCNCKRTDQPKSYNPTSTPRLRVFWHDNIEGKEYEEISFEDKQTLNQFFHDIYPLNNSTDGVFIYNKLKNII